MEKREGFSEKRNAAADLAIVGAGPCGLAAGVAATRAGLSCLLFDRGCLVNAVVGYPTGMTFFSAPENLEIGDVPFVCSGSKPSRHEALVYYRRVAQHYGLPLRQYEEVVGLKGRRGAFELTTRGRAKEERRYHARHVVIATGYFDNPNMLGVPGEDLPKVTHYYREGHPYFDQDCLVIGGGNSAAETALDLWRSGARVTVVHFLDGFDAGVKPWVRPDIENRVRDGAIAARFLTRAVEIAPARVRLQSEEDGRLEWLANRWVFAMTGYSPNTKFLRELGVNVDAESGVPRHDPETMETNVPGIFIAGVIAAGRDANKIFIENGREHGERIVSCLARAAA